LGIGLRLAHYVRGGATRVGVVDKGLVFDLADAAKKLELPFAAEGPTIDRILSNGVLPSLLETSERIIGNMPSVPIESIRLLSPILNPEKILLMAVNYHSHSKEQNAKPPSEPYLFTKFRNALIGPGEPILIPKVSKKVDWEVELAVIIGKTGKYIPKKDAMNHVAGYAISNDVSFRDFQFSTRLPDGKTTLGWNWVKGKGLDSSFPLGPWLVTRDEIQDPHALEISLSVNGKTMQQSKTSDMVFKIDSLIEYVSAGITLKPGDIISTGTPEGVAVFTGEPFLKDGDIVEGSIERIGTLRNPVKAE
jgi:2-keto-4-pentenoate hydratase/2-oxohepta-3-ene-1,7-dioic acid hydratase in catechol pathway